MTTFILFASFLVLLLMNVPIAITLGLSSLVALLAEGIDPIIVPMNVYASTSKFVLLAIPFFILGGNIMERVGISRRLIVLAEKFVGHLKGGMAIVCVLVACFFAAISGSGPATVAALGMIIIPAMIKTGYSPEFSSALMASSGAIGVIIPPSITFVVYGSIAGASIGTLFIAGVIPGILVGLGLVVVALVIGKKLNLKTSEKASWRERLIALKDAFWGLMMPVIILGGIYGGIFTPTEAAAVSAVYGLFVGLFIYRSINVKELYQILVDSTSQTAVVMLITATASLFAWVITVSGIGAAITSLFINVSGGSTIKFFIIVNVILLIAGMFLDSTSALFIFTPLFLPVAKVLGINLIHLGVVMIVNLAIGLVTPPVGVNLYVACGIGNINLQRISKAAIPLLLVSLAILLAITYVPQISLLLPGLM
ncbi:TRAP transporter large permease [Youngiibacter multivorans]|uniref:C4-dicarboxylate transporter DctM subunit n=1 Tax=Youngiibacter multivorans TaxID=937251 RepID=A0ABS4G3B1_9CLOT|nr:TRAP transporter large permease [Youngiibacter multivorans]MBP1919030.1 C4-dicarboxylate transporter DctM subunit [Youngiibacter multivorans]